MKQPLSAGLSLQCGRCASSKVPFPVTMRPGLCSPFILVSPQASWLPLPGAEEEAVGDAQRHQGMQRVTHTLLLAPPGS